MKGFIRNLSLEESPSKAVFLKVGGIAPLGGDFDGQGGDSRRKNTKGGESAQRLIDH